MGHFTRTSPGHPAGGDGNALGFTGISKVRVFSTAPWMCSLRSMGLTPSVSLIENPPSTGRDADQNYASLAIAGLFKLIHNLFRLSLRASVGKPANMT